MVLNPLERDGVRLTKIPASSAKLGVNSIIVSGEFPLTAIERIPCRPWTIFASAAAFNQTSFSRISISICEPEENTYIKNIEKLIKQKIEVAQDNPFEQTDKPMNKQQKKEFEKEKQKKRQEFFANRKKRREKKH